MQTALIVGAGSGLSGSLARLLAQEGWQVGLAARNLEKLASFKTLNLKCDASDAAQVEQAFVAFEGKFGVPDLVVYNASYRTRGPFIELDAEEVKKTLEVSAFGGFLVAQAAAKRMLSRKKRSAAQEAARPCAGAIFFTGASASVKGYAQSAPFAMGKFALRGLAQSLARELAPKNIHVAHFVIDGGIRNDSRTTTDPRAPERGDDGMLLPDEIAKSYLQVYRQHRSAWSWELELRPWVEKF
jgi:NAD(P)-dependent dehydrogenase (short-subunit alcohol dehydrogenase family)